MDEVLLFAFAFLGWTLASAGWALWWGMRGRLEDVRWTLGLMLPSRADRPDPGPSIQPAHNPEVEAVFEAEIEGITEGLLADAEREGVPITPDEAREEAKKLHANLVRGGLAG